MAHYKKALELDPSNETYKSNLQIAELKLREMPSPVRCRAGGWGPSSQHRGRPSVLFSDAAKQLLIPTDGRRRQLRHRRSAEQPGLHEHGNCLAPASAPSLVPNLRAVPATGQGLPRTLLTPGPFLIRGLQQHPWSHPLDVRSPLQSG